MNKTTELSQSERDLLESFEDGEWRSVPDKSTEIERYRECARVTSHLKRN